MMVNNYTFYLKEFPLKLWTILAPHNRSSVVVGGLLWKHIPIKKIFFHKLCNFVLPKVSFVAKKDVQSTHRTLSYFGCSRVSMRWKGQSPLQSHPGSMEQLLEWGRTSPWAMTLVTLLGLVSCLRIAFGLLKNLRDLIWAYILPRIWPVDLVKTYGKWVVPYSWLSSILECHSKKLRCRF